MKPILSCLADLQSCMVLLTLMSPALKLLSVWLDSFQYLEKAYKKDGDRLFSTACCSRTRGDGFKLNGDLD